MEWTFDSNDIPCIFVAVLPGNHLKTIDYGLLSLNANLVLEAHLIFFLGSFVL